MTRRALFTVAAKTGPELQAGPADCRKLYDTLMQEKYGGIDADLSPPPLVDCSSAGAYMAALFNFLTKAKEAEQRIIYFTGHGKVAHGAYGFVLEEEFLPFATVTSSLLGGRARTLFILDTCHSGAAELGGAKSDMIPLEAPGSGIFASSRDIQLSHEDGVLGSLFTNYLCECILTGNGGVPTTGGLITVPDAIDFIRERIEASGQFAQNPIYTVRNGEGHLWIALSVAGSLQQLSASAGHDSAEDTLGAECPAAELDALDTDLLVQYSSEHLEGVPKTIESIADALGLRAPGRRNAPSKAAILCFGRRPSTFFPNALSMFSAGDLTSDSFERSPLDGPLLRQLQNLMNLTTQQLRTEVNFDDEGIRSDALEIPVAVLREVIANALAHRDFSGDGRVHVHVDAEYVTVSNPGFEPDGRTWPDMLDHPGVSLTSNRRLANLLQAVRGYEGVGRGFNVLHRYRQERGNDSVVFEQRGRTVICKLRRPPNFGQSKSSRTNEARLTQFVLERANALSVHGDAAFVELQGGAIHQPQLAGRERLLETLSTSLRTPGELIALSGSAGVGKSYTLRQLYVMLARDERNKVVQNVGSVERRTIPIFLSLRELNADLPFTAGVSAAIAIEPSLLEYIFEKHDPILLLDGLDECAPDTRTRVVRAVRDVKETNPRISILISSRPIGDALLNPGEQNMEIGALSSADVNQIVSAGMPAAAGRRFLREISRIGGQLLSNPLMLRLAMQMYEEHAELPTSIDGLIAGAFGTLWHRHDATKGQYVRQRRTSVEAEHARRLLSRIALFLVARRASVASKDELIDFLRKAIRVDAHQLRGELSVRPEDLILDFAEAGLLHVDDKNVSFAHRTFTEYFALDAAAELSLTGADFGRIIVGLLGAGISADRVIEAVGRWPGLDTEHATLIDAINEEASSHPVLTDALREVRDGVSRAAQQKSRRRAEIADLFDD